MKESTEKLKIMHDIIASMRQQFDSMHNITSIKITWKEMVIDRTKGTIVLVPELHIEISPKT